MKKLWPSLMLLTSIHADADALSDMLEGGKLNLQMRPRYEFVQQDGKPNDANAFTMRTLLGYTLKPESDFGGTLQFINVSNLGPVHFNNTRNGQTAYPVVADPAVNDVNQAFVSYAGLPQTQLKFGRQIIILDNSRWVGNVDFRQNMQTFDALSFENNSLQNTTLFASHISHVKGSYANFQTPVGYNLQHVNVNLFHASFSPVNGMNISAYDYFYQDKSFPQGAASNISSATPGLRLDGATKGKLRLLYTAEYAKQRSYGGGQPGIDARYETIGGGAAYGSLYGRLDYEKLGANSTGTYGLQTPLATKHIFNGWADQFLVTPGKGLRDVFATLGGKKGQFDLLAMVHDYRAAFDSTHYGSEWDLSASRPFTKHLSASLIYADYRAKDGAGLAFPGTIVPNVNTRKAWLTLLYNY